MANGKREPLVVGVNDLETLRPDLMKDWDWENNTRNPWDLQLGSSYTSFWICHICGHKWKCRLDSRTKNMHGCPMCARGGGSSIPDYTLYKLLDMSLDCEVLYRYNVLTGYEADVYIPSKGIIIEYDGYGYHKQYDRKLKDSIKESKFIENGYSVYRISERKDRDGSTYIKGNSASVPEMIVSKYDNMKERFVYILSKWGIIDKDEVPLDFYNLDVFEIKKLTSKPVYKKSVAYYLDENEELLWDYSKNSNLNPLDIFATVKEPKIWLSCDKGHSFNVAPNHVRMYGCPICSGHRVSEYSMQDIAYNFSIFFKEFANYNGKLEDIKKERFDYSCPFCGEDGSRGIRTLTDSSEKVPEYCKCTKIIDYVKVSVLGVGLDGRVYSCANIKERYFLFISENLNNYLLDKASVTNSDLRVLDDSLFKEYIGDPYIMKTSYNSWKSIPTSIKFISNIELRNSEEDILNCYDKLRNQKITGLKISSKRESYKVVSITKKLLVDYMKVKLENRFNTTFALNRTVNGLNTSLVCKRLNMTFLIRVNICKSGIMDVYEDWFSTLKNNKIFFLSDRKDLVNEENGFFYIPSSIYENELEDILHNLYLQFIRFYGYTE